MTIRRNKQVASAVVLLILIPIGAEALDAARAEQPSKLTTAANQAEQENLPAAPSPFDKDRFRVLQTGPFVPGYAYVRFRPDASPTLRSTAHAAAGANHVLWESKLVPGLCRVALAPGQEVAAIHAYLDDANVWYAEPGYETYPTVIPNDTHWSDLWGMLNCRADLAWDVHTGGSDFKIAIIDAGTDYNHEDLAANIWTNPGEIAGNGIDDDGNGYVDDVHGYDFGEGDSDPFDSLPACGSHGTHVAGITGAMGNNATGVVGLNWQCKLVACKTSFLGSGWCKGRNAAQALEYALLVGCRVSNNSYGSSSYQQALYDMIEAGQAYGHLFVAAAGNGGGDGIGDDNDAHPFWPSDYDLPNIISVAAIDVSRSRPST